MGLVYPMVLSTLLMLGILGTIGYLFSLPASISKIVRTSAGEELELKIEACMRPSFWEYTARQFMLAWRVGGTPRSTVNIRFQITVTGTNIANTATAYLYVEARDSSGSPTYRELNYASGTTITVGSATTFETGSMAIDTHLSHIYGSVPTADKTVDYYLWCKVEVTGLISGRKLTAEIPVQKFDSVLYDYGVQATATKELNATKSVDVRSGSPDTNYAGSSTLYVQSYNSGTYKNCRTLVEFNLTGALPSDASVTSVVLMIYPTSSNTINTRTYYVYRNLDNSWSETTVTWNTAPPITSGYVSASISNTGFYWTVDVTSLWASGSAIGFTVRDSSEGSSTAYRYEFTKRTTTNPPKLRITYNYLDWSASWSWLNLDTLSISSLKVTQELAPLILVFVSAICIMLLLRRR
jgi:hypothetical protein